MKLSCIVTALSLAAPPAPALAQQLVRAINGPEANAMFGKACIRVDDQNGDGYDDLLVGAPGFNSQRGAIYCVSGAYLASGTGAQVLWSLAPTANQGDLFGHALAKVGDATGDGIDDFLVGQPGYDITGASDIGAVRLVSGSSHAVVSLRYGFSQGCAFGTAVAAYGANGAVVGAPGPLSSECFVHVLPTAHMATSGQISNFAYQTAGATSRFGASLAAGADFDGDGVQEFVVGEPGHPGPSGANSGRLRLFRFTSTGGAASWGSTAIYDSSFAGENFGESVDASHDYDGDGVIDIVVGAPNHPGQNNTQRGRCVVLSGARLAAQTPPYELYTLLGSAGAPVAASYHFGAAVRSSRDLNNDGVGDFLVGSPDFFTTTPVGPGKGAVTIFSGATGVRITGITGANNDHLGDALAGAVDDLDGDGFPEFVVAGSLSDAGGTDSGVVKCYRLFPVAPGTYCTGKINSLGCTPAMGFSGSPSANPVAPFLITASNLLNQKNGLLFYSHQPNSAVFQGGFLCAKQPTVRTLNQNSGGSASGSDCSGTYSFDFNAWSQTGIDPTLVAGAEVFSQYWSRDPQVASKTSLSNALRFVINP